MSLEEDFKKEMTYFSFRARLNSFTDKWPWKDGNLAPKKMAEAGYYYTGEDDIVCCPFCIKTLSEWNESDIPVDEQKSRGCHFITLLSKREEDYTVGDYLGLISFTRASIYKKNFDDLMEDLRNLSSQATKTIEGMTKHVAPKKRKNVRK